MSNNEQDEEKLDYAEYVETYMPLALQTTDAEINRLMTKMKMPVGLRIGLRAYRKKTGHFSLKQKMLVLRKAYPYRMNK